MSDRRRHPWWVKLLAFLVSPWAEKNPVSTLSSIAPIVLSMSRISVSVFTVVAAYRIVVAQTIGWPEIVLAISCMYALPVLAALSKVSAQEVVAFGAKIIERLGVGAVAQPPYPTMDQGEHGP